ncbi:MAG: carbohydrate-binding module family 20 domain-containing protein [Clostridia bacterium]
MAQKVSSTNMKINVEIKAKEVPSVIYLCGNSPKLGLWKCSKALRVERGANGIFSTVVKCNNGEILEFKILKGCEWKDVEKGIYNEEIVDHAVDPKYGKEVTIVVWNWAL